MLTQIEENGVERCSSYWPNSSSFLESFVTFGRFEIKSSSVDSRRDYVVTHLLLTDLLGGGGGGVTTREIMHFQVRTTSRRGCIAQ